MKMLHCIVSLLLDILKCDLGGYRLCGKEANIEFLSVRNLVP